MAVEVEGGTVLEHLQAQERQTGETPDALLAAPSLPDGCEPLWTAFRDLHACRGGNGFGPGRITFTELDAFQRVTGFQLQAWEIEAIHKADAEYLRQWAERQPKQ